MSTYAGSELELFRGATHWKQYLSNVLRPVFGMRVAEVGAGLGGTTRVLCSGREALWLCIEPDRSLAAQLGEQIRVGSLPKCCKAVVGTIESLGAALFDTICYVDVLEHIADDRRELAMAVERLAPEACLVVVAPAHGWLYSPFDRSIGHYRRYNSRTLRDLTPNGTRLTQLYYLDSVGLLASCANKWLLRRKMPGKQQIWVWDRVMVPLSRILDPLFGWRLGKTIIAVWHKTASPPRRTR